LGPFTGLAGLKGVGLELVVLVIRRLVSEFQRKLIVTEV
jgi:hypothetical protein